MTHFNHLLKIHLLKRKKTRCLLLRYDIVVTRYRSHSNSRLDKIGTIGVKSNMSIVKIDMNLLYKYLGNRNVRVSYCVWKALNLDWSILNGYRTKELQKTWSKN